MPLGETRDHDLQLRLHIHDTWASHFNIRYHRCLSPPGGELPSISIVYS
jgi:hypothetical protein